MPFKSGLKICTLALMLSALAACQSMKTGEQKAGAPAADAQASQSSDTDQARSAADMQAQGQAEDLRLFVADTKSHDGWAEVQLQPEGVLYVRPQPVIDRTDLEGIQSAKDDQGNGVLVLILGDEGQRKVKQATQNNPNMRLALVVGDTMLAAPGYQKPIDDDQLAFGVGSPANADQAARAVAGPSADEQQSGSPAIKKP